ncbi:MAG TPA: hypothetical protein VLH08_15050 [Acidobacteriota bacterium]|nr:hypothetical protein [Acidobacteriota bacterium]
MNKRSPLATVELRWFFQGTVAEYPALMKWYESAEPFEKDAAVKPPEWKSRIDNQPDIYLLTPGSNDLGIKWREGLLQIKGRVAAEEERIFSGIHQGKIEHWIKWSCGQLPAAYKHLFTQNQQSGIITVPVQKIRTLRKIALTEKPIEVDVSTDVHRAIEMELSNITVAGKEFCSLGFEAYPDDSALNATFTSLVESFLKDLKEIHLSATQSKSYPAWLRGTLND